MNEVKKKRIGKAGISILILAIVAVVLTTSNLLVYISLSKQIANLKTDKKNLNIQVSTLRTEKSNLNTDISNLQSAIALLEAENNNLQSEKSDLQSEIEDLESEVSDFEREINWLRQVAEEDNFQFYYASLTKQRYGVDDLEEYLDRWEWTEESYVEGVFDCSEMSAYIEWRLENEGYHTYIVCGESPWGDGYHAWLLAETSEGEYMPVEATQYELVKWSSPYFDNYFIYDHLFETIQDALDYNYSEYDWWN